MAGVPIAAVESYVQRLTDQKISVALINQKKQTQDGGGVTVTRQLERIVTPAVQLLGDSEEASDAIVAAIYFTPENVSGQDMLAGSIALACSYPASGRVKVYEELSQSDLFIKLSQFSPTEVILPAKVEGKKIDFRNSLARDVQKALSNAIIKFRFIDGATKSRSREYGEIAGYSVLSVNGKQSARSIIDYLDEVTVGRGVQLDQIETATHDLQMLIDASTRNNLELVRNQKTATKSGSLYDYLDLSVTSGGSRLLRQFLLAPSTSQQEIDCRLETVRELIDNSSKTKLIRECLQLICDLERAAARIELGVISPRELAAVRDALLQIQKLPVLIKSCDLSEKESHLKDFLSNLNFPDGLLETLLSALSDDPPAILKQGGVIRAGFNPEIDRLTSLKQDGKSFIAELQEKARVETGVSSLKIKFNSVHNYFFEVTKTNASKIPDSYTKKQTTVNYERYITPELKELEDRLMSAESALQQLEFNLYQELKESIEVYSKVLRELYRSVAMLDVMASFAALTMRDALVRPELVQEPMLVIEQGRHPILMRSLGADFVANDLSLFPDSTNAIILTGPNMGGKSTYLRQTALIVVMAQIGCFIPASNAKIGIVDRIFARIGASDDQSEGDSTFMVEMREAAEIIAAASPKSLILIDEIGRGTSTTDGLAIAQAILEWILTQNKSRLLFATHFHSLTGLDSNYQSLKNFSVASVDVENQVIFTHEVIPGAANQSYGIEVAKLAGLPEDLLRRAQDLVSTGNGAVAGQVASQLALFSESKTKDRKLESVKEDPTFLALQQLAVELVDSDLDQMTPLDSMKYLYELKKRARELEKSS